MSKHPKPSLHFVISKDLRDKTIDVLEKLEQAENPIKYSEELGTLVTELTTIGMHYFFIQPLALAKISYVTQQSAKVGISGTQKVICSAMRRIIRGMNKSQLLIICGFIRNHMH